MNISKDGPDNLSSGTQKQDTIPDGTGSVSAQVPSADSSVSVAGSPQASGHFPMQSNVTFSRQTMTGNAPVQPAGVAGTESSADPMRRLAEIVAQSSQPAVEPQAPPVRPSLQSAEELQPMELTAGERMVAPVPQPSGKGGRGFSLFRRAGKAASSAPATDAGSSAASISEPVDTPEKKGFRSGKRNRRGREDRASAERHRRTGREKRWARRRRRVWFEELLGWIFVPIILIGLYWSALGLMALFGTTPEALMSGFRLILSHF